MQEDNEDNEGNEREFSGQTFSVRGLSQRFGRTMVLQDIEFDLRPGERLVLLGPTGSGKTTLLRAIAGLDEIESGEIRWGESSLNQLPPHRRQVGFIFQDHVLYPHLSVGENLKLAATKKGSSALSIDRITSLLGLTKLLVRRPDQISGGEQQRVAIARALLSSPRVVCFDEPFSNLDLGAKAILRNTLFDLHTEFPATWILVTHDPRDAALIGDRTAVLDEGRLLQIGTTDELQSAPVHRRVAELIDDPPMNLVECSLDARRAIAGFRPEDARIQNDQTSAQTNWVIEIQARRLIRSQGLWRLDGMAEGVPITALLDEPPTEPLPNGATVRLEVDPAKLFWFDARTGAICH